MTPEDLGARCDECILSKKRVGGPVMMERHPGSTAIVIAEAPGERECEVGRPLVGPSGIEFNESLKAVGYARTSLDLTNALCCRPPENDLDKLMLQWQRENKKREALDLPAIPSPVECCRPRLLAEIDQHHNIVTLGKTAFQAVTRRAKPVLEIRGGPVEGKLNAALDFVAAERHADGSVQPPSCEGHALRVLPTLHPAFVLRARRWTRAFRSDLSRAFRWFGGSLGWKQPAITLNPSPADLDLFLSRNDLDYVYDVETTIDDPLVARLKCVGIANEYSAVVVFLWSPETDSSPYNTADDAEVRRILRDFFADPMRVKVGHNAGYFDRIVIEQHFGVTPQPLLDTILLHRSVESELPHKLGYIGSVYTDVTSWKENHTAKTAETDFELGTYCAVDCVVTARVAVPLGEAVKLRGQEHVAVFDHRVQDICVGLHRMGMRVDMDRRHAEAVRLLDAMGRHRAGAQAAAGVPTMNLNSTPQLRKLLFDEWNITPANFTKLGDPSTNDESLRLIRTQNLSNRQVVEFLDELRRYRRAAKEYGTYVRRLVPYGKPLDGNRFQSEEEEETAERGLILSGRVHPDYNAHGTTSGRLSSSNPNAQNWPKHLRAMIIPAPGNVIVGADADQLELRIIASRANIARYLEVIERGGDPHAETASMMFGHNFDSLEPKSDQWSKLRGISKGIAYASFYGSGDETVHGLVTSAEDAKGNLLYPDLTLREVSTLRRNWLKNIPELPRFWDDTLDEYRAQGFVLDPLLGRRRDFLDGEAFNEIVNFPIQSAGAHIIHYATFAVLDEIPFEKWGPHTGLIAQVHDALYVECPAADAPWVEEVIRSAMDVAYPQLPGVRFKAKPKTGSNWGEV
jgi:DNA polymerase I-like protein with 3'-5' exonuclease and polymerase domains/uracil-DNA glycosylase